MLYVILAYVSIFSKNANLSCCDILLDRKIFRRNVFFAIGLNYVETLGNYILKRVIMLLQRNNYDERNALNLS